MKVTLDLTTRAALDTLLAIEGYVDRVYFDRKSNPADQERCNDLADIVLPLREAMDTELARRRSA